MLALPLLLAPTATSVAAPRALAIDVAGLAQLCAQRELPGPLALEAPRLASAPVPRRAVSAVDPAVAAVSRPGPAGGGVADGAWGEPRSGHERQGRSRAPPWQVSQPTCAWAGR